MVFAKTLQVHRLGERVPATVDRGGGVDMEKGGNSKGDRVSDRDQRILTAVGHSRDLQATCEGTCEGKKAKAIRR